MLRANPLVAVTDPHGDDGAMLRSWAKAGVIEYDPQSHLWQVLNDARDTVLVILGDLCDRGTRSFEVFKLIEDMRKELQVHVLAGNHDIFALGGLAGNLLAQCTWLTNGGMKFYEEILKEMGITQPAYDADESNRMLDFLLTHHASLFSSLQAVHQQDNVLYVHSGSIEGKWEELLKREGVDGTNKIFSKMISSKNDLLSADTVNMTDDKRPYGFSAPFWARGGPANNPLITPMSADVLDTLGVDTVVHGHNQDRKSPFVNTYQFGSRIYKVINLDAGISNGYRKTDEGWAYLKIDRQGLLHAESDRGNTVDLSI